MTDHAVPLAAPFRPPEDADRTTITAGRETANFGGEIIVTRQSASDIVVRAALSQANQYRILTLPYPVGYQVFWQELADLGVTQERLMERLGASP